MSLHKIKEGLLVDCTIKAIRERLKTTLANIKFQKGVMLWDDEEKIEHCIIALSFIENEIKREEFRKYSDEQH